MTEVYYGDLSRISAEDLDHIDEVSRKHIVPLSMQPGDTLLIDNYRCVGLEYARAGRGWPVACSSLRCCVLSLRCCVLSLRSCVFSLRCSVFSYCMTCVDDSM